ncbi:hypothetical protein SteCoe_149 [Stentor coeruleus]|uniref:Kelch motif family protein n=1 Tax=Stentor coeruleus TaxID=5963 RepID=A0A1R2D4P5_9CILI|nr:hypothetical protein SteCoe_149 [Stentor coeruleus]
MEQNTGIKLFIDHDVNYSSVCSNFSDYSTFNQTLRNYSEVEAKVFNIIEYLKVLEKNLLDKTAYLVARIEKDFSNMRKYIVNQRLQFEIFITQNTNIKLPEEEKSKILLIDISCPKNILNSASKFCKKIDKWYNFNIFKYLSKPSPQIPDPTRDFFTPNPVENKRLISTQNILTPNPVDDKRTIRGDKKLTTEQYNKKINYERTFVPQNEAWRSLEIDNLITVTPIPTSNNNKVNQEVIITAHSNQFEIQIFNINSQSLVTKRPTIAGNKVPYWPIMEQIESSTYFFYGGVIDRTCVASCFIVSLGEDIVFIKKRDYIARSYASAAKYQDCIYVFGGSNIYLGDDNGTIRDCSKYNYMTNIWSAIAYLDKPTYKNSSSCIFNHIFIVGNNYQYCLKYNPIENIYLLAFIIGEGDMMIIAERWLLKRGSPDLLEITENGTKTHKLKSFWDRSKYGNLEIQTNTFKRGNMIYLVEHAIDRVPKIFRLDIAEKTFNCIRN